MTKLFTLAEHGASLGHDSGPVLERSGTSREVAGNAPFLLDRPDGATFVAAGEINLFLVELRAGEPAGSRHYVGSVKAGDLMFGIRSREGSPAVGLLAVGSVGTRVVDLSTSVLQGLAGQRANRPVLFGMIERWIAVIAEAPARVIARPRVDVVLGQGDRRRVGADARVGLAGGLGWLRFEGGAPLYLDSLEIGSQEGAGWFPLSPAGWAFMSAEGEVACGTAEEAYEEGQLWAGLAALHDAVLEGLPLALRLASADEANRLRARVDADEAALARGVQQLAAVLGGSDVPASAGQADTLFRACSEVARDMGVTLAMPQAADPDQSPSLDRILRANRLRKRQVALRTGWWRGDVGSLLLAQGPGDEPAAVLRRARGYVIVDAISGVPRPLSAREAAGLAGPAFMLYEPLPDVPLTTRHILGWMMRWGRADLSTLLGFGLIGGLLGLAAPIALGYLVQSVIPGDDRPGLIEMAAVLIAVAAIQLVIGLASQRARVRLEGIAGARLQAAVIDRLIRLPTRFFRDFTAGDLATRALAIQRLGEVLTGSAVSSVLSGAFSLLAFGLMLYYSPLLGGVACAIAVVLGLTVVACGLLRLRYERDITRLRGRLSGELLELTTGIAKLRLASAETRAFARWAEGYASLESRTSAARGITILNDLVLACLTAAAPALLFAIIVYGHLLEAGLGLGVLVAFLAAFGQAMSGFTQLAHAGLELVALRPIFEHARPILEAAPEANVALKDPGALGGAIEISHVGFRYNENAPPVFTDLSLQIGAGEHVALVGRSGCGKSTVVRLLLGFETPDRGAILFDGKDLRGLDVQAVRRQMGVVLQSTAVFGVSILDNILGAHLALGEPEAWRAAARAGLDEDIRAMPMGMQTVVSEATLSGGQLQRVAIARALVSEPRIVIFDEATSALDNRTQAIVTESLNRMQATRIVIAHRLSTVMGADRIVVIEGGAVIETGSYDELMGRDGVFASLAARQLA